MSTKYPKKLYAIVEHPELAEDFTTETDILDLAEQIDDTCIEVGVYQYVGTKYVVTTQKTVLQDKPLKE